MKHFLKGRILLAEQVEGLPQYLANGEIELIKGIQQHMCMRCHNKDRRYFVTFHCARCNGLCTYCRKCIQLGRVSSCTTLVRWCGEQAKRTSDHTLFVSTLTRQQQRASDELIESFQKKRHHLLHAVCGAGKTEILFQPILYALQQTWRVCIATPRTDVVLELFPRLQRAFPHTVVQALYGGADVKHCFSPLIVATTHQLLRFEQAFDLIIVDEADAFPYTYDVMLQQAVIKAKTTAAPICFVTATPSKKLLQQQKKEQWGYSFLPRRYHQHVLPVPRIVMVRRIESLLNKRKVPVKVCDWLISCVKQQKPFLLFLPTIELIEKCIPVIQELVPHVEAVHASDPKRKEKVLALRNGQLKGLVTSTILERGITISNVQVAVLCADAPIFNAGALIQISGRVGRNAAFPAGDIVFFSSSITIAMDEAVAEIKRLNAVVE